METRSFVPNTQQRGPLPVFINENIKAPNILVIDQYGQNIGVVTRQKALELKDACGLDLVQISYDRDKMISTAKIVDYGKHQYQKGKEEKERRKKQKKLDMKEIKIGYAIGDNDLAIKVERAIEFLQIGHAVKFSIRLRGREKIFAPKAKEKLMKLQNDLLLYGRPRDAAPKEEIHGFSIILFAKRQ